MKCLKRIYLIYLFGFFFNFRLLDPFLYELFVKHYNITEAEVSHQILPILSYSTAVHLVFIFLFIGFFSYKVLLIISSISGILLACARILASTLLELKLTEILRGTLSATEIAYYIYVFSYYDSPHFQRMTTYIRSVALLAKAISAYLGFHCIDRRWISYKEMLYVDLTTNALALVSVVFLPTANENFYKMTASTRRRFPDKIKEKLLKLKTEFVESFNQEYVIKWSVWFVWSVWSYKQISIFIQPLWSELIEDSSYNGIVEAFLAIFAFFGVLIAGLITINWKKLTVIIMPLLCGFQYILLLSGMAFSDNFVLINYISYVLFGVVHHFVVTAMSVEIAKIQQRNSFGLVFSFLYMIAYSLNAILVCVVNDEVSMYVFEPQEQFFIYFVVFVIVFIVFFMSTEIKRRVDSVMVRH